MRMTRLRKLFPYLCHDFVGTIALVMLALTAPALADDASPVDVAVLENSPTRVLLDYSFGEFADGPVRIDGQAYMTIDLGGESHILRAGAPDLPNVCRSVIIPDDAAVGVYVIDAEYYELTDVRVAPSKGNLLRTINPADVPYKFDESIYGVDAFYPGDLAELSDPYILRDQRGVVVRVNPFQYNPAANVLRVYTSMTIEVVDEGPGKINVMPRGARKNELSLAFHQIYKHHFLNYDGDSRYAPLDETGDMLIVCHDAWIPNIQPFVDHKNSIGISTSIVGVSTIGNNATAIKNHIQSVYNTSDLAFVLLVGDIDQVDSPDASGGASDPSYAKLAGDDDYPEILVGRFSASTPAHVDTQVERTIEYENMPATEQDWFWKGVGIASAEGAGIGDEGQSDIVHNDEIRDWLLGAGYTHVDRIYDPGATSAQVSAALNAGRGVMNYTGHGWWEGISTTGFDVNAVNALTNDNMLPFMIIVACNPGEFDNYATCYGEACLRATHAGEPTGAIGCYASSISQSWAPPMEAQDEFVILLTDPAEPYHSYGAMCFAGSCSMMDDYDSGGVSMFNTWILFGDPSLRVRGTVQPPTGLKVAGGMLNAAGPRGGPFSPDSTTYTLTNYAEFDIDYLVTADIGWIDITNAAGTLAPDGTVEVVVSLTDAVNSFGGGVHSGEITFTNLTNHDGDATRAVNLNVDARTLQYEFNMDADPGWSTAGQWAWGHPTGQGGYSWGSPDPSSGATGANVCGVNLVGDYSTSIGGPYYLIAGPFDMKDMFDATLEFQRWLNSDYQPYVSATLDVSANGTSWTNLWENGGSEIADSSWSLQSFDISEIADGSATVYVRWGYAVLQSGAYAYSGWNIDDVEIWAATEDEPVEGDVDGDGDVDLTDLAELLSNYGMTSGATWEDGDVDGDGDVDLADLGALLANYGFGV